MILPPWLLFTLPHFQKADYFRSMTTHEEDVWRN